MYETQECRNAKSLKSHKVFKYVYVKNNSENITNGYSNKCVSNAALSHLLKSKNVKLNGLFGLLRQADFWLL